MRKSMRTSRMDRTHRRKSQHMGELNLVPMIDIFCVMVVFLLSNFGDVHILDRARNMTLPDSISELKGAQTVVVAVGRDQILIDTTPVMAVKDVDLSGTDPVIPKIRDALLNQLKTRPEYQRTGADVQDEQGLMKVPVTILGDKSTSYKLLKRIMASCAAAGYQQISLGVAPYGVPAGLVTGNAAAPNS